MSIYIDEIVGNDKVKLILSGIVESKNIPHAILFSGADGFGKESCAISFAKAINIIDNTSSDTSKIIKQIENLSEPYIKYILPLPRGKNETDQNSPYEKLTQDEIEQIITEIEKKALNSYYKIVIPRANFIKISSIRDIKKFLSLNYDDVKYRVIIISQADLMNDESQNALLKNLEEPPRGVLFILCTSYPEKLRETIRSRCWKINFQPLSHIELFDILVNKFSIEKSIATEVIPFASGSIQEAINLIENDFEELREKTIRILRYSFGKKYHSAFLEFEEMLSDFDQAKIKLIIRMILLWLNDFQKYRLNKQSDFFYSLHLETLEKFNTKFPDVELIEVTNNIDKISSSFKNNVNLNLSVSNIIFQLSSLTFVK
jgi:DNA polymerase-3 subunit delta'